MAAGYRSNAARWLGGTASSSQAAGYRSVCARWLGGASAYTGPARPGYASMLAYWLGGAASYTYVPIPEEPHGGGAGRQYEEGYLRQDEEDMLILMPMFLAVIESED